MDDAHREKIATQRSAPHYDSDLRDFFYGKPGERVKNNYLLVPLGSNYARLEKWAWKIRQTEKSLANDGFASDFLKERLEEEKQKWQATLAVLEKHGSAP